MLKFRIEKKVKIKRPFGKDTVQYAFYNTLMKMKPGDSFLVENNYITSFRFVTYMEEFRDMKFISRTEDSKHKRIHRYI